MDMMTTEQPDIESSTRDYATRFSGPIGEWFLYVQEQGTERHFQALVTEANQSLSVLDAGGVMVRTCHGWLGIIIASPCWVATKAAPV